MVSGFFEPVLYLLSMGIGLGALVGTGHRPRRRRDQLRRLHRPGAAGRVGDERGHLRQHLERVLQDELRPALPGHAVDLPRPGRRRQREIFLALLRGALYATGFTTVMGLMGLITTPWALLMIPASVLIAFGFAAFGMAITSYMKTFQQMEWVNFVMLPMFLFSATFYPLSVYPQAIQWLIQALPLWHGVELLRQLSAGVFTPATLIHVSYYAAMILVGVVLTTGRLRKLFLK
jgi:lipooligosaccharide transport system permease protein